MLKGVCVRVRVMIMQNENTFQKHLNFTITEGTDFLTRLKPSFVKMANINRCQI